jgi:general secretion pathway protein A
MPAKKLERRLMLKRLGFAEDPFMASADPRFLYLSTQHGEVLERARDVIEEFNGLAVVEGSYGVGKSSLALRLESLYRGLPDEYRVVFIHTTNYESEFAGLQDMCEFIGVPHKRGLTKQWRAFEDFLVTQHEQGRNVVIILDDAQLMAADALRIVHTLYNFDAGGRKLAQVILFGQPELGFIFAMHPEIRSRVSSWFRLNPLSVEDTVELIRFRCKVAGRDEPLLTQAGYLDIYEASQGTPRAIVSLCTRLLEHMAQNSERTASSQSVEPAIRDWRESYTGPLATEPSAERRPTAAAAPSRSQARKPRATTSPSSGHRTRPSAPARKAGKSARPTRS